MELSLVPLYEGQALICESIERLREMGFQLIAVEDAFVGRQQPAHAPGQRDLRADARMKVLVISSKFPPLLAPESEHTMFLCQKLAEHETVHLITSSEAATTRTFPFTVHAVMPGWTWRSLPRLIASIRSISPDAILLMYVAWTYNYHPMITFLPTICRVAARNARFVTQFENVQVANNRWTRRIGLPCSRAAGYARRRWQCGHPAAA